MALWKLLRGRQDKARRSRSYRPRLEALETRELPSVCTVDRLTDNNPGGGGDGGNGMGDLRWCVTESLFRADTIDFSATGTINLAAALPTLTRGVSIDGPGANLLTVRRDTGGNYRIFTVASGVTASISGLTINNGVSDLGAGISNSGTLTISSSIVSGNTAIFSGTGGGILNSGMLTIDNSIISGDSAGDPAQANTADQRGVPRTGGINIGAFQASATTFLVADFPSPITAGTTGSVTVTACDPTATRPRGYRGTVHFTSSDTQATLPADYPFPAADNGVHTFSTILKTAGTQSLTATDTATGSITGTQAGIVVTPAAPDHFALTTSVTSTVAGTPFDVTVTVQDQFNNTVTGYRGTVTFSSQDPYGATLPPDYTFQAGDQGTATFPGGAALYTAGTWDVTATDTQSGISGSAFVNVIAAPAAAFQVLAPAIVTSGAAFDVTVLAVDAYGNTDTNYQGTITFSTSDSDPGVVLPPDYTFQAADAGMVTFPGSATLMTPGDQTLAVTDTSSGITGAATVTVTAGNEPVRRAIGLSTDVTDCTDDVNWCWIDGRRTRRDRRPGTRGHS